VDAGTVSYLKNGAVFYTSGTQASYGRARPRRAVRCERDDRERRAEWIDRSAVVVVPPEEPAGGAVSHGQRFDVGRPLRAATANGVDTETETAVDGVLRCSGAWVLGCWFSGSWVLGFTGGSSFSCERDELPVQR
jgi:hypothetical protein